MPRTITISLPVAHLAASKAFHAALGFVPNPKFSDHDGAFMTWSDAISIVLPTHAKWRTFTDRPIAPRTTSEVALNISCESRAQVDAMNASGATHGGTADINPPQEDDGMYGRDFADPDGHIWGALWMEPSAQP